MFLILFDTCSTRQIIVRPLRSKCNPQPVFFEVKLVVRRRRSLRSKNWAGSTTHVIPPHIRLRTPSYTKMDLMARTGVFGRFRSLAASDLIFILERASEVKVHIKCFSASVLKSVNQGILESIASLIDFYLPLRTSASYAANGKCVICGLWLQQGLESRWIHISLHSRSMLFIAVEISRST